jgi:hypothetical protein
MIASLAYLIVYLVVLGLVIALLLYLLDAIPVPPPFYNWLRILIIVIGVLVAILILLNFIGIDVGGAPPRLAR